jgi:hypothetical protein
MSRKAEKKQEGSWVLVPLGTISPLLDCLPLDIIPEKNEIIL